MRHKTFFNVISFTYQQDRIHKNKFSKVSTTLEEEKDPDKIPNKVISFNLKSGVEPCCLTCKKPGALIFTENEDEIMFWCDFICYQEFLRSPRKYYENKYAKLRIRVTDRVLFTLLFLVPLLSAYIFTLLSV